MVVKKNLGIDRILMYHKNFGCRSIFLNHRLLFRFEIKRESMLGSVPVTYSKIITNIIKFHSNVVYEPRIVFILLYKQPERMTVISHHSIYVVTFKIFYC